MRAPSALCQGSFHTWKLCFKDQIPVMAGTSQPGLHHPLGHVFSRSRPGTGGWHPDAAPLKLPLSSSPPETAHIICFQPGDGSAVRAALTALGAAVTHLFPRRGAGGTAPSEAALWAGCAGAAYSFHLPPGPGGLLSSLPGPTFPTFRFGILQGKEAAPPRRQIPAPRARLMQQLPALIRDLDPNVCGTKSSGGAQSCRAPAPRCFPWDQRLFRAADKNEGRTPASQLGQGGCGKDSTPKRHPSSMLSLGKGCAHNPQGPISPPPAHGEREGAAEAAARSHRDQMPAGVTHIPHTAPALPREGDPDSESCQKAPSSPKGLGAG